MRTAEALDLYLVEATIWLAPSAHDPEQGSWTATVEFATLPAASSAPALGQAVRETLARSREARRQLADPLAESARVDAELLATIGPPDRAAFVAAARWVAIGRSPEGTVAIVPSDAIGGAQPAFRPHLRFARLDAPTDEQLGAAARSALERCHHEPEH